MKREQEVVLTMIRQTFQANMQLPILAANHKLPRDCNKLDKFLGWTINPLLRGDTEILAFIRRYKILKKKWKTPFYIVTEVINQVQRLKEAADKITESLENETLKLITNSFRNPIPLGRNSFNIRIFGYRPSRIVPIEDKSSGVVSGEIVWESSLNQHFLIIELTFMGVHSSERPAYTLHFAIELGDLLRHLCELREPYTTNLLTPDLSFRKLTVKNPEHLHTSRNDQVAFLPVPSVKLTWKGFLHEIANCVNRAASSILEGHLKEAQERQVLWDEKLLRDSNLLPSDEELDSLTKKPELFIKKTDND